MDPKANKMPSIGDLSNLSPTKLQELETVLASILALPVARQTYAQIIDGKSNRDLSQFDMNALRYPVNDNLKPSDRAVQLYEEFKVTFAPQGLKIDLQVRSPLS